MQVRGKDGANYTITDSGILKERSGMFGLTKKSVEIPFQSVRAIAYQKALFKKFWIVNTREGIFEVSDDSNGQSFIRLLKEKISPYSPSQQVIVQQAPGGPVQREVREKETVKIRCSHCRTLNPDTNATCLQCGARL